MTITRGTALTGSVTFSAPSATVTLPTHAAGDRLYLPVVGYYSALTVTGGSLTWVKIAGGRGGSGTPASDVGDRDWAIYAANCASGSETAPTLTITDPGANTGNASWGIVGYSKTMTYWADPLVASSSAVQFAYDTDPAAPLTATSPAWGITPPTAGDHILCVAGWPTSGGGAIASANFTATGLTITRAFGPHIKNVAGWESAFALHYLTFTGTASTGVTHSIGVTGLSSLSGAGPLVAVVVRETNTAPPPTTPGPPTDLFVDEITPTSMQLNWTEPTTGAEVDTYYLTVDGSIPHDNGPLEHYTFNDLEPNTEYLLGVASGSYVYGASAEVTITESTSPLPAPGVPGIVSATVTSLTATLLWATPTSGGPVDTYQVRIDGGAPATETSPHVFTGLLPETEHDLEVRAVNGTGASGWALATITTATPDPPNIVIGWDAVASESPLFKYEVALDGAVYGTTDPGTREYEFTGLAFDTEYSLTARALDITGLRSEWSEPLVVTTPELT